MKKSNTPIDRENATDVEIVPEVDVPFPEIPFDQFVFRPEHGFGSKDAIRIMMAFMFKVLGVPVTESSFNELILTEDYVNALPEPARKHFKALQPAPDA